MTLAGQPGSKRCEDRRRDTASGRELAALHSNRAAAHEGLGSYPHPRCRTA